MVSSTNDIGYAIGRVVNDLSSYYLIGFTPPEEAFSTSAAGQQEFHRVRVTVRKAGLHVRSRSGFFGAPEADERASQPAAEPLVASLDSPFHAEGVQVGVQCSFLKAGRNASAIRASQEKASIWRAVIDDPIFYT
jgi:hypothetical protein